MTAMPRSASCRVTFSRAVSRPSSFRNTSARPSSSAKVAIAEGRSPVSISVPVFVIASRSRHAAVLLGARRTTAVFAFAGRAPRVSPFHFGHGTGTGGAVVFRAASQIAIGSVSAWALSNIPNCAVKVLPS